MAERLIGLVKFGKRLHIADFVSNGHIYMNNLEYFKRLEDEESPLADSNEAATFSLKDADGATLKAEFDGEYIDVGIICGPLVGSDGSTKNSCVYCMYGYMISAITSRVDPRNFDFGDSFAVVTDGVEFLRRVKSAAAESGIELEMGLVEYVDKMTYQGEMGVFRKFSGFSYQSEYRIVVRSPPQTPLSLRVGNLSDIVRVGELAKINEQLEYQQTDAGTINLLVSCSGSE